MPDPTPQSCLLKALYYYILHVSLLCDARYGWIKALSFFFFLHMCILLFQNIC